MKLTVLVDNNTLTNKYFHGEPALCFYIEDNKKKILFDTGYSDIFIKNAQLMNIDLSDIDYIVISHEHENHIRGLKYYFNKFHNNKLKVIAHTEVFNEKYYDDFKLFTPFSINQLKEKANLQLSQKPIYITENLIFLGEVPRITDFENRERVNKIKSDKYYRDDFLHEDSAIVYKSENGFYILTGCSHSGICNIIEYAKRVCQSDEVLGVIGGFHLEEKNYQLKKTIDYFVRNNIDNVYPCHCVSLKAKIEMGKSFEINEVGVGLTLEWGRDFNIEDYVY